MIHTKSIQKISYLTTIFSLAIICFAFVVLGISIYLWFSSMKLIIARLLITVSMISGIGLIFLHIIPVCMAIQDYQTLKDTHLEDERRIEILKIDAIRKMVIGVVPLVLLVIAYTQIRIGLLYFLIAYVVMFVIFLVACLQFWMCYRLEN